MPPERLPITADCAEVLQKELAGGGSWQSCHVHRGRRSRRGPSALNEKRDAQHRTSPARDAWRWRGASHEAMTCGADLERRV